MELKQELRNKIIDELKDRKEYIYTDYRDFENVESLLNDCESVEDFEDKIYYCYYDCENNIFDNVINEIMQEYDLDDEYFDDIQELVFSYLEIEHPVDEFLNQNIYCNIICDFYNESKSDFTENGWLRWLLYSQGYKLSDYPVLKDFAKYRSYYNLEKLSDEKTQDFESYKNINKFFNTLCVEIENMYLDSMRAFTCLTKLTIKEYLLYKENKLKSITLKKDVECGLFNMWSGCGSVLEIALEKDIKINAKNIYNIQVEKMKNNRGYTVDQVYGICFSCYKEVATVEAMN